MSVAARRSVRALTVPGLLVILIAGGLMLDGAKIPGVPFPANSLCAGVLVVVALFKAPPALDKPRWFAPAVVLLIIWLVMASVFDAGGLSIDIRRTFSVSLWAALAIAVGSGRIPQRLIAYGLAVGVVVGTLWGLATIRGSGYAGRLTGVFGDPNTAGLLILTFTCLALPFMHTRRTRWLLAIVALVGVYCTLSRTTFLAAACVIAWVLVGRRISRWFGGAAVIAIVWWATTFAGDGLSADQFQSRAGSDDLRQKIMDASQIAAGQNPWLGHGLGTAHVQVGADTFFFHSSYLSMRQEGGWPAMIIFLIVLIGLFLALTHLPPQRRNVWIEASFIGIAICATNLGEVFLRIPTAAALGFAVWHLGTQRREMAIERKATTRVGSA
ncbi:hypothetical protein SCMU_29000 [Sinomonas cyclohexanicum]|uniref:O-antigen ligase-related domain-containing protein n=1 Tax=Sinomonas cyclohexanicum TaxID=322009 RepID=A0ABN6FK12_SINCY|nr:O-antigen ligase family protein [Corynebacterium cyclohexanicum]BCT77058.1 hypothetical protein SCMU_29000 [Corynebacterium cyclohexanicum]